MATRKQVFEKAKKLGVEIQEWRDGGDRFFQADAPQGKHFIGSTVSSAYLGDYAVGEKPDWKFMLNEIELER
tara:strand:+ start:109 stop:324 length:216 start_codon:yes stop_codon:yes gene_type:complete